MSPLCAPEKTRWWAPSSTETIWMSLVGVAQAKALPSGCHTHLEVVVSAVSSRFMTPSIVLNREGSGVVVE